MVKMPVLLISVQQRCYKLVTQDYVHRIAYAHPSQELHLTATQQQSFRINWWRFLYAMTIIIGLFIAAGIWWFNSTTDLEKVRAKASSLSIPITASEQEIPNPPNELSTKFLRLYGMMDVIKTYNDQLIHGKIEGDKYRDRLSPFQPVPNRARLYHLSLDSTAVTQALALFDSMPADPTIVPRNQYLAFITIRDWLVERVLIADSINVTLEINRLLKLQLMYTPSTADDFFLERNWMNSVYNSIALRLLDVQPNQKLTINLLTSLKAHYFHSLHNSVIDLFQKDMAHGADVTKPKQYRVCSTEWVQHNFKQPSLQDSINYSLRVRTGRNESLNDTMHLINLIASDNSTVNLRDYFLQIRHTEKPKDDWGNITYFVQENRFIHKNIILSYFTFLMNINTMLAVLEQQPWPRDLLNPAEKPLRELRSAGKFFGAYSVGIDGVDNGGDRRDDLIFRFFGSRPLQQAPQ